GRSWIGWVVGGIGLAGGIVALVIALDARNTSNDAATKTDLTHLQATLLGAKQQAGSEAAKLSAQARRLQEKQAGAAASASKTRAEAGRNAAEEAAQSKKISASTAGVLELRHRVTHLTGEVNSLSNKVA